MSFQQKNKASYLSAWRKMNPQKKEEYALKAKIYRANRELTEEQIQARKEYERAWRAKNKDKIKEYKRKEREKQRATQV